jgi:hypothetical protein
MTNIIKKFNVYPSASLLLRLLFDLAAANLGMFMGSFIAMMVWMHRWPKLTERDMIEVVDVVEEVMSKACR